MKTLQNAINQAKRKLIAKAKQSGVYENFGQNEVRKLEDKFLDSSVYTEEMNQKRNMINEFDEWAMNYS